MANGGYWLVVISDKWWLRWWDVERRENEEVKREKGKRTEKEMGLSEVSEMNDDNNRFEF